MDYQDTVLNSSGSSAYAADDEKDTEHNDSSGIPAETGIQIII